MWQFPCTRGKNYTSVDNFLNSVFHILLVTLVAQALILIVWGKYEVGSCLYSASLSSPHSETCRCHQETWECPGEVFKWTRINKVLWDVHGVAIRQDDFHPRWLGSCFHNALYWKVWGVCGEIKSGKGNWKWSFLLFYLKIKPQILVLLQQFDFSMTKNLFYWAPRLRRVLLRTNTQLR